jgi:hypothetical protein
MLLVNNINIDNNIITMNKRCHRDLLLLFDNPLEAAAPSSVITTLFVQQGINTRAHQAKSCDNCRKRSSRNYFDFGIIIIMLGLLVVLAHTCCLT